MRLFISIIALLLLVSCFSCNNDDDAVTEGDVIVDPSLLGTQLVAYTWKDCSSTDLNAKMESIIHLYTVDDQFDSSNKEFHSSVEPNDMGLHFTPPLNYGYYYYEVEDMDDGSIVMSGIFNMPEALTSTNSIPLKKSRKRGWVYEVNEEGEPTEEKIPSAQLKFTHEITGEEYTFFSNEYGRVCVELNPGRYHLIATREGYEEYNSDQGGFVFTYEGDETMNIPLKKL